MTAIVRPVQRVSEHCWIRYIKPFLTIFQSYNSYWFCSIRETIVSSVNDYWTSAANRDINKHYKAWSDTLHSKSNKQRNGIKGRNVYKRSKWGRVETCMINTICCYFFNKDLYRAKATENAVFPKKCYSDLLHHKFFELQISFI